MQLKSSLVLEFLLLLILIINIIHMASFIIMKMFYSKETILPMVLKRVAVLQLITKES